MCHHPTHLEAEFSDGDQCGGVGVTERLQHIALVDAVAEELHAQQLQTAQTKLRVERL